MVRQSGAQVDGVTSGTAKLTLTKKVAPCPHVQARNSGMRDVPSSSGDGAEQQPPGEPWQQQQPAAWASSEQQQPHVRGAAGIPNSQPGAAIATPPAAVIWPSTAKSARTCVECFRKVRNVGM
jgi:hypothetical protein